MTGCRFGRITLRCYVQVAVWEAFPFPVGKSRHYQRRETASSQAVLYLYFISAYLMLVQRSAANAVESQHAVTLQRLWWKNIHFWVKKSATGDSLQACLAAWTLDVSIFHAGVVICGQCGRLAIRHYASEVVEKALPIPVGSIRR